MHQQVVDRIAEGEGGDIRPIAMAEDMTKLAIWMTLTGVDSQEINNVNNGGDTALKPYSLSLIGVTETSERARAAFYCLMLSFLSAQVTVAPLQTSAFSPEILNNVTTLLFTLGQQLPDMSEKLGWSADS